MLRLSSYLLIGRGGHKHVYHHPEDSHKCVKLMFESHDGEMRHELTYRKVLKLRNRTLSMLPQYFGVVETNMGKGYCFEKIVNFDSTPGFEITKVLSQPKKVEDLLNTRVEDILMKFRTMIFEQKLVVRNIDAWNFMIQRTSPQTYTIRAVDNLGIVGPFSLAYLSDYLAVRRLKKQWNYFLYIHSRRFPNGLPAELAERLKV